MSDPTDPPYRQIVLGAVRELGVFAHGRNLREWVKANYPDLGHGEMPTVAEDAGMREQLLGVLHLQRRRIEAPRFPQQFEQLLQQADEIGRALQEHCQSLMDRGYGLPLARQRAAELASFHEYALAVGLDAACRSLRRFARQLRDSGMAEGQVQEAFAVAGELVRWPSREELPLSDARVAELTAPVAETGTPVPAHLNPQEYLRGLGPDATVALCDQLGICLAGHYGLSAREICALRVGNLDPLAGTLRVRDNPEYGISLDGVDEWLERLLGPATAGRPADAYPAARRPAVGGGD